MVERWHYARGCLDLYIRLARGTLRRFALVIQTRSLRLTANAESPTSARNIGLSDPFDFQHGEIHMDSVMDYDMSLFQTDDGTLMFLD